MKISFSEFKTIFESCILCEKNENKLNSPGATITELFPCIYNNFNIEPFALDSLVFNDGKYTLPAELSGIINVDVNNPLSKLTYSNNELFDKVNDTLASFKDNRNHLSKKLKQAESVYHKLQETFPGATCYWTAVPSQRNISCFYETDILVEHTISGDVQISLKAADETKKNKADNKENNDIKPDWKLKNRTIATWLSALRGGENNTNDRNIDNIQKNIVNAAYNALKSKIPDLSWNFFEPNDKIKTQTVSDAYEYVKNNYILSNPNPNINTVNNKLNEICAHVRKAICDAFANELTSLLNIKGQKRLQTDYFKNALLNSLGHRPEYNQNGNIFKVWLTTGSQCSDITNAISADAENISNSTKFNVRHETNSSSICIEGGGIKKPERILTLDINILDSFKINKTEVSENNIAKLKTDNPLVKLIQNDLFAKKPNEQDEIIEINENLGGEQKILTDAQKDNLKKCCSCFFKVSFAALLKSPLTWKVMSKCNDITLENEQTLVAENTKTKIKLSELIGIIAESMFK